MNTITRTEQLYITQKVDTQEFINELEMFLMGENKVVDRESLALLTGYIQNGTCARLAEKGL